MSVSSDREISCRITRTLLLYVRERNNGSLGPLLEGLDLEEDYLLDPNNWVSHAFLQILYHRMITLFNDESSVYKMALSSGRLQSLGLLDGLARLLGSPKHIYSHAAKYNRLLKLNGEVYIHESGDAWVVLEDRYHRSTEKTRYDCDYTRGILVGIPTIFNMAPAYVEEIECQVSSAKYGQRTWPDTPTQGAGGCLYRVRWDKGSKMSFLKYPFGRRAVYRKAIEDLQEANRRIQEKYDEVKNLAADLSTANKQLVESKQRLESYAIDLRASEERYRFLANNVSDVIWTLNLETMRFTYASPSIKRLRGFTPEEAMNFSLEETIGPESVEFVTNALGEELARDAEGAQDPDRHRALEIRQLCKDGSWIWTEATMSFIRDDAGRPVGILGVTRDISERKRAEEQRNQLQAILSESRKMESIGTLAGGIAHDFNNILMGIRGLTSLMLLGIDSYHPHFDHLQAIEDCVKSASELTRQILGFARSGKYEVQTTDLNRLVDKSCDMFGRTKKEIVIHKHFQEGAWPADVDRGQIDQVLMNLYINAWHAMPGGGDLYLATANVIIDATLAAPYGIRPGKYVKIVVRDTGVGMDEKTRQRIFEPFFTTKAMGRGTGLGLASSYGIIRNHGGIITVSSETSRGSSFTIYLPASSKQVANEVNADPSLFEGTETILLVDDEEMVLKVGQDMLRSIGYTVLTARGGKEAITVFEENNNRIALVILDMIMPDLGGGKTFEGLRAIKPGVRVLLSSGYSLDGEAARILNQGCKGFLQKPFSLHQLSQKVREILENSVSI